MGVCRVKTQGMGSFNSDPHHAMQVCRDFWHRGKCYLDGPESSLEYWKQEREKSQWETVLVRLKPQHKNKHAIIHPHTHHNRKLPHYFFSWATLIGLNNSDNREEHWFMMDWWVEQKKKKKKSSKVTVNMSHQNLTCGTGIHMHTQTHTLLQKVFSFFKLCSLSLCASLPPALPIWHFPAPVGPGCHLRQWLRHRDDAESCTREGYRHPSLSRRW